MNGVVSSTPSQLTVEFTPGLSERHSSLLECVREAAYANRNPLKTIAADMDMSQSDLSRKLSGNPDDPRRFTVDDLEQFLVATGDFRPIFYLIEKYLDNADRKKARALDELAKLAPHLEALMKMAQG